MTSRAARYIGTSLVMLAAATAPAAGQEQPDTLATFTLDTVRVEASRLRAGGVPLSRLAYGAQVVHYDRLPEAGAATLADALEGLGGVTTASQFGSPLQPDVRFRGFQVGPVVGYPQGVSVFVDGVRVNEPDASQVYWDLVPLHAVERIEVVRTPGGPFGRNALAGAINVVTRSGGDEITGAAEVSGGSFGTAQGRAWVGSRTGGFHYLASGRYYRTEGWRSLSAAELRQLFTKVGYESGGTGAWLSYTFADDYVEGPGSLPRSWLRGALPPELSGTEDPRRLQFTGFEGDYFEPRLHFAVANLRQRLGASAEVQANGFIRSHAFDQFNDNITEPNALGKTGILSWGGAVQASRVWFSGATWTGGVEYVHNGTDIRIFERANAAFPDAGGLTERVGAQEDNLGIFSHLWWPASPLVDLSGSLRYDYVYLPVRDWLDPEKSGENTFNQITGSAGVSVRLSETATGFASYGHGFRAPVILEVTCADPEDPCQLPFELGADPPLRPVKTDTWQAGVRYLTAGGTAYIELAGYWTEVRDDIFNVVAAPSTRGFFTNLERTRRQGVELSVLTRPLRSLELEGSFVFTRPTFQSEATLTSAVLDDEEDEGGGGSEQPEGDEGAVDVEPGDRFAMVPNVSFDVEAAYSPGPWRVALEGAYVGSQFFIGDEGNEAEFGRLGAYFVLDAAVERTFGPVLLFARGENLLDEEFYTFGIISPNVRGPEEEAQPFLSPALPRHVQVGLRYSF